MRAKASWTALAGKPRQRPTSGMDRASAIPSAAGVATRLVMQTPSSEFQARDSYRRAASQSGNAHRRAAHMIKIGPAVRDRDVFAEGVRNSKREFSALLA